MNIRVRQSRQDLLEKFRRWSIKKLFRQWRRREEKPQIDIFGPGQSNRRASFTRLRDLPIFAIIEIQFCQFPHGRQMSLVVTPISLPQQLPRPSDMLGQHGSEFFGRVDRIHFEPLAHVGGQTEVVRFGVELLRINRASGSRPIFFFELTFEGVHLPDEKTAAQNDARGAHGPAQVPGGQGRLPLSHDASWTSVLAWLSCGSRPWTRLLFPDVRARFSVIQGFSHPFFASSTINVLQCLPRAGMSTGQKRRVSGPQHSVFLSRLYEVTVFPRQIWRPTLWLVSWLLPSVIVTPSTFYCAVSAGSRTVPGLLVLLFLLLLLRRITPLLRRTMPLSRRRQKKVERRSKRERDAKKTRISFIHMKWMN